MTPDTCMFQFPFSVETTDLNTGIMTKSFHKTKDEVHQLIKETDEENQYRCGWDRQLMETIGDSHAHIDIGTPAPVSG
jgi:hypothetical protein